MEVVYNAPETDIFIGSTSQASGLFEPRLEGKKEFDPKAVKVIGGVAPDPRGSVGVGDFAAAYPSLKEAAGGTVPLKMGFEVGAPGDISAEAMVTPLICDAFKLNCKLFVVSGDSTSDVVLMMERGEVNFNVSSLGSIAREQSKGLKDGTARMYFVFDDDGTDVVYPEGVDPPNLMEILPPDAKEKFDKVKALVSAGGIGKIFWTGPNVPSEAIDVLRQAWDDFVNKSPSYADFERLGGGGGEEGGMKLPVTPLQGAEAQRIYDASAENFVANEGNYGAIQEDIFNRYFK